MEEIVDPWCAGSFEILAAPHDARLRLASG